MNDYPRMARPLLPPDTVFQGSWPMSSHWPVRDWRYFRHGKLFGIAVKCGQGFKRLSYGPGRFFLFDHPDEAIPVMRAFVVDKDASKGGRRHGR